MATDRIAIAIEGVRRADLSVPALTIYEARSLALAVGALGVRIQNHVTHLERTAAAAGAPAPAPRRFAVFDERVFRKRIAVTMQNLEAAGWIVTVNPSIRMHSDSAAIADVLAASTAYGYFPLECIDKVGRRFSLKFPTSGRGGRAAGEPQMFYPFEPPIVMFHGDSRLVPQTPQGHWRTALLLKRVGSGRSRDTTIEGWLSLLGSNTVPGRPYCHRFLERGEWVPAIDVGCLLIRIAAEISEAEALYLSLIGHPS